MKKSDLFWGIALVVAGAGLLLGRLIGFSFWQFIGPMMLIGLGGWFIWGSTRNPETIETEQTIIPLASSQQRVLLKIKHGLGTLAMVGGADNDALLSGTFVGGLEYDTRTEGDNLTVSLTVPSRNFWPPVLPPLATRQRGFAWTVALNEHAPMAIEIEGGMNEQKLDLSRVNLRSLRFAGGLSSSEIMLPRQARHTRVRIDSGLGSVALHVPEGVGARITSESGLASMSVDQSRFAKQGDIYISPDYDLAENTVEIDIHQGLGSITID